MKNRICGILIPFLLSVVLLTGCQEAPEVSEDEEILRAKSASDEAIEEIVKEEENENMTETSYNGETVDLKLGTDENCMRIEAKIPAYPAQLSIPVMQADSRLNEEVLRAFLEPQGDVEDIADKMIADWEAEKARIEEIDKKLGEGSSIVELATIGDDSFLALTDGNRTATMYGKCGVSYKDALLDEKCYAAAKNEAQKLDVKAKEAGDTAFSLQDAKELLLKKLSFLGIEDMCLYQAYSYEEDGFLFYEMEFVPSMDGISVAWSFGSVDSAEVYPRGHAWVCAEGAAHMELYEFCMEQVSVKDTVQIISWDKVRELLGTYLENGSLQCIGDVPFSVAELVYKPELKEDGLELVPAWNLHMDLGEYVEYAGETGEELLMWNIYIDGATGKLIEVQ